MSANGYGNQDIYFEPEQSWVKCKYSIPDDVFDENGYIDLMLGARGYIKSYKVNGKYAEIEPEQRIEGVATEVIGAVTIEGTTGYLPLFEYCPEATTITSEMTFTLSRTVQPTDYILMCAYDGDGVLQMYQPAGTVQELISAGYYDMYFTFLDNTHYHYGDAIIAEMSGMAGFHMFLGFVDPEYFAANALQMPTLKTYTQSVQILGGIQNIGVNKSDLDENGECEVEYQMVYLDVPDIYGYVSHIDSRFNSSVLKEIDLKNITKSGWTGIKPGTFHNNESLTKFIAGDKIDFEWAVNSEGSEYRENSFSYCSNLAEIIIENNSLWTSKYNAVVLKESNTIVSTCVNTTYINVDEFNINNNAFHYNYGLTELIVEGDTPTHASLMNTKIKKFTRIGCVDFNYSLPSTLEHLSLVDVESSASYRSLINLKTLELTNVKFTYNSEMFSGLTSLTTLIIHQLHNRKDGTSSIISNYAHFVNSGITNVVFGDDVTCCYSTLLTGTPWYNNQPNGLIIVNKTLIGCKYYTPTDEFIIPDHVQCVAGKALFNSTITSVDTNNTVSLYVNVFPNTIQNIHIGPMLNSVANGTYENLTNIDTVTVDSDNSRYHIRDGYNILFAKERNSDKIYASLGWKDIVLPTDFEYYIGGYAFTRRVSGVLTVPNNVTEIKGYAFSNCSITDITIPDSVTSIGNGVFYACSSLTRATIGNNVTEIGAYAFRGCTNLTSITLPDGLITIGDYAFNNCKTLTNVSIPDSVTSIGAWAFSHAKLTNVNFSSALTWVGESAFYACEGISTITISSPMLVTDTRAFSGIQDLNEVIINNISVLASYAFQDCDNLTTIYCKPITPPTFGYNGLIGTPFASGNGYIYVPNESVIIYKNVYFWNQYSSCIVGYNFE